MTSNALYELFRRRLPRAPVNTVMFLTRRTRDGFCGRLTSIATNSHYTMFVLDHGSVRIERPSQSEVDCASLMETLKRIRLRNSWVASEDELDVSHGDA
ncbi:protein UL19 [Human betaherpesvirus 5]|uniref:Protein UL19 n=1 Tax=Human cytomegalovirus TaxID=10359 RepID=A0A0G2THE7_HCMV|nr:protein UL19 [Human betaherpesvirus 5]